MKKYTTENIEHYLEGKLDKATHEELETAMMENPELKEEIALQQAIVKRMERMALASLIADAHYRYVNRPRFGFRNGTWKWIGGIVLAITLSTLLYFYAPFSNQSKESKASHKVSDNRDALLHNTKQSQEIQNISQKDIETESAADNNSDTATQPSRGRDLSGRLPEVSFSSYTFLAQLGTKITDKRSGTVITIPPNALRNKSGRLVRGKVELKYREFRTQADIALSEIPMTYHDQNFNSAGMFEIWAVQGDDTLEVMNRKEIAVDFVMTKNEPGIGFYALRQPENRWEYLSSLDPKKYSEERQEVADRLKQNLSFGSGKGNPDGSYADRFVRSMGYQNAAVEGTNVITEVPSDFRNLNELFSDKDFKRMAGASKMAKNLIRIRRMSTKEMNETFNVAKKTEKSKSFWSFFADLFSRRSGGSGRSSSVTAAPAKAPFYLWQGDLCYEVYETGDTLVLSELKALDGEEFIYNGKADLSQLVNATILDLKITKDTTVFNRFTLELKTDKKIMKNQVSLKAGREPVDFRSYEEYVRARKLRMMSHQEKIDKLKKLQAMMEDRKVVLDSLLMYGEDDVYDVARLIMTDKELDMSRNNWYAYLKDNRELALRVQSQLDSVKKYGDRADVYINKLMAQKNIILSPVQWKTQESFQLQQPVWSNESKSDDVYSSVIQRLSLRGFGIYNCDQVYRIQQPVVIEGIYYNEENKQLTDLKALSVVDKKVNAAFQFNPRRFTCSAVSTTSLILFTLDDRIYYFDAGQWKEKVRRPGRQSLMMKDITDKVKSPEDLQRILDKGL